MYIDIQGRLTMCNLGEMVEQCSARPQAPSQSVHGLNTGSNSGGRWMKNIKKLCLVGWLLKKDMHKRGKNLEPKARPIKVQSFKRGIDENTLMIGL